ncbi:AhpD-like protein [Microdochium trichocladiopsis]|uniref:AhpD-like protein n=1 Tax=Microdochium trichocladiopsis TaxID=1682393 RepID=A0A9P8XZD3_9PEZI|nr:AhpD-like protein [Microdochium trichocladiopsis]KAH7025937.1 AhpD-like protein [Microdochium trichocladiopsis]
MCSFLRTRFSPWTSSSSFSSIPPRLAPPPSTLLLLRSTNTTTTTTTATRLLRPLHTTRTLKMRIPYVPDPPNPGQSPEDAAVVDRVRQRRHPRPLQPLDLALLHSPPVADGWNSFIGAIRTRTTSLPDSLRELAICRIAVCNRAWYEWAHHAPLAVQYGVSQQFMDEYVKGCADLEGQVTPEVKDKCKAEWAVGDEEWVVLRYTDEMTRNVHVPDEVFAAVKALFDERTVVELTATVAAYNCVSRFLVALDVGERNATGPDAVVHH